MSETHKILSPLKSKNDKSSYNSSDLSIIIEVPTRSGCGDESIILNVTLNE